mmetsp:Transcript_60633/g.166484  ORF Transcript_60633/g.166484 Transcript_60633/m.166484 type:complete len:219 (+) Transcript_60633:751-1407(+)
MGRKMRWAPRRWLPSRRPACPLQTTRPLLQSRRRRMKSLPRLSRSPASPSAPPTSRWRLPPPPRPPRRPPKSRQWGAATPVPATASRLSSRSATRPCRLVWSSSRLPRARASAGLSRAVGYQRTRRPRRPTSTCTGSTPKRSAALCTSSARSGCGMIRKPPPLHPPSRQSRSTRAAVSWSRTSTAACSCYPRSPARTTTRASPSAMAWARCTTRSRIS